MAAAIVGGGALFGLLRELVNAVAAADPSVVAALRLYLNSNAASSVSTSEGLATPPQQVLRILAKLPVDVGSDFARWVVARLAADATMTSPHIAAARVLGIAYLLTESEADEEVNAAAELMGIHPAPFAVASGGAPSERGSVPGTASDPVPPSAAAPATTPAGSTTGGGNPSPTTRAPGGQATPSNQLEQQLLREAGAA